VSVNNDIITSVLFERWNAQVNEVRRIPLPPGHRECVHHILQFYTGEDSTTGGHLRARGEIDGLAEGQFGYLHANLEDIDLDAIADMKQEFTARLDILVISVVTVMTSALHDHAVSAVLTSYKLAIPDA